MLIEDNLVEEIEREIKNVITEEHYKKIDSRILKDFAKIGAYLRKITPKELEERFKSLNDELEKKYKELGMIAEFKNEDGSISKHVIQNKTKVHQHKVFTTVIENWAKTHGLNQGGKVHCIVTEEGKEVRKLISLPDKIPTIFGFIKPSIFRVLLSLGYLFKDVGAGKDHGEFTHLLVIYLIIEVNKLHPFLEHKPEELYKMLGNEYCFKPGGGVGNISIWDVLFDDSFSTVPNRAEEFSKLLRYFTYQYNALQVMSNMLNERFKKREKVEGSDLLKFQLSGKKAAERLKNAPGILLDEMIFFFLPYSNSRLEVRYDEVTDVCHYDVALKCKSPLSPINLNKDKLPIDQVITLFDTNDWQIQSDDHTKNLASQIHDKFLRMKMYGDENSYVSHRIIAETLEEFRTKITKTSNHYKEELSIYRANEYINFLINESKKILLDYDLKDVEKTLTSSDELMQTQLRFQELNV